MAVSDDELRAIYEHVLRAMVRYQVTVLLFVHHQQQPVPATMQSWLLTNWLPRAIREAGYRRVALVESPYAAVRPAARAVGDQVSQTLEFAYFDNTAVTEAEEWLLK